MKKLLDSDWLRTVQFTVPFNNMQTLKFKAQLTNVFFATINQRFGKLLPASDHVVWMTWIDYHARSAVVGSWEEPLNIWLTVAKNAFVCWTLNFRVCMLLKDAVSVTQVQKV